MIKRLSSSNLAGFSDAVSKPSYDRSALKPGVLHIGLGNFHRAHQAVYLNDVLNAGGDPAWGILGAGVRDADSVTRAALRDQDCLYTVVEVEFDQRKPTVVGALTDVVEVQPNGNAALIKAMSNPETKIVSLTVTEGGYFLDGAGALNLDDPALRHDIQNPATPTTAFGAMIAALAKRKAEGAKPFTLMSCDNLPGNGDIARNVLVGLAKAMDPELARWIEETVTFPNGMVDRITPATSASERELLAQRFGIQDKSPVFCEPFRQWVLEDKFVDGRPELERVGVTFTKDIESFEKMKLRVLNGGHAILAYASAMLGIKYAHEAVAHPLISSYLRRVLEKDALPFVEAVPGFTPQEYLESILVRFSNPGVADTISRLCYDGSNRQPKFIIGSIKDNLKAGKSPNGLALSSALWCRYCLGRNDRGEVIEPNDPNWDHLHATAQNASVHPGVWLDQDPIYGAVDRDPEFRNLFEKYLRSLQTNGTEQTISTYLADTQ
ncbi:MAG: mannitol dehydrogenase family protein [Sulfitobacter sp.]